MGANVVDPIVSLGAVTLGGKDVVDLIGQTWESADGEIDIIKEPNGALLTDAVDEVVSRFADADSVDFEGVDILTEARRNRERCGWQRSIGIRNTNSTIEDKSLDAVTSIVILVID